MKKTMIEFDLTKPITVELDPAFFGFRKTGLKKGSGQKLESIKQVYPVCIVKLCSICKVVKLGMDFSKDKSSKTGRKSQCKKCMKEYYQSPEYKQKKKEYHEKNNQYSNGRSGSYK